MNDNYDPKNVKSIRTEWLNVTDQPELWESAKTKFLELYPFGLLEKRRDASPPLSGTNAADMKTALSIILHYEHKKEGDPRIAFGVIITGAAQHTSDEHQATIAWYAANYVVNHNATTRRIYLARSIEDALRDLGILSAKYQESEGKIPDLIRVTNDGKLDILEVRSKTDSLALMIRKRENIRKYLQQHYPGTFTLGKHGSVDYLEIDKKEADLFGIQLPRN
jgi:hypothetical protein